MQSKIQVDDHIRFRHFSVLKPGGCYVSQNFTHDTSRDTD